MDEEEVLCVAHFFLKRWSSLLPAATRALPAASLRAISALKYEQLAISGATWQYSLTPRTTHGPHRYYTP